METDCTTHDLFANHKGEESSFQWRDLAVTIYRVTNMTSLTAGQSARYIVLSDEMW